MQLRKSLASLLAVATLGAGAVVASAPAMADETTPIVDAQNIAVDLDQSTGAVKHGATGFLYGIADDGAPTDTMLNGLSHLDSLVGRPIDGQQHPNGDVMTTADQWKRNGGGDIQIYLKDFYPIPWPYSEYKPDIEHDYFPLLKKQVEAVQKSPYKDSYVYVPLNEPDCGDANYNKGVCISQNPNVDKNFNSDNPNWVKMKNDWKKMFQYIRSLDPEARIAGPNFSSYYSNHYRDFLQFAKENNVIPDIVTWHELNSPKRFTDDLNDWNKIVDDVLGPDADIPVSINEYAPNNTAYLQTPGSMVQYVARFENTKVSADLPYWQPAGDLDQLVVKNNQATGSWWLYNWYGRMTGNTVNVQLADANQTTQAVASYDETKQQARVLFGGSDAANYAVNLKFDGTKFPNGAHVTVYGIDKGEPSTGDYVVGEYDLDAAGLKNGLALSGLKKQSAYYAVLTPQTAQSPVENGRYEAEYARLAGSAQVAYGAVNGYSGTGYVQGFESDDSDTAFFVTADKGGYYDVNVRYSAPADGALPVNRKLDFKLNRSKTVTMTLPQTADANTWNTAVVRVYLPVGVNQIDLVPSDNAALASGVKIDYVQPVATDSKVDFYEAESSDNTLSGTAKVDGNAVSWVGAGEGNTLQFNKVNASEDGDYTLTFAYAQNEVADNNNFQTKSRWADVTVNGDSASTQHVVFTNTRSWKNYWTTSIRVTLKKGENTVLLGNANGYAPNFDSMTVARTAVQTSPEPSVDKSALEALIAKAKGVAKKDYTKESYAVLSAALQPAEAVDAKADASQDEVDTAAAALQKALDGLKKAEGGNDGAGDNTKPGADNQGNTDGSDNGANGASKDAIGNTGAAVGGIALAAIVLAVVGALIAYRRSHA